MLKGNQHGDCEYNLQNWLDTTSEKPPISNYATNIRTKKAPTQDDLAKYHGQLLEWIRYMYIIFCYQ